jgi:hypothetical protein
VCALSTALAPARRALGCQPSATRWHPGGQSSPCHEALSPRVDSSCLPRQLLAIRCMNIPPFPLPPCYLCVALSCAHTYTSAYTRACRHTNAHAHTHTHTHTHTHERTPHAHAHDTLLIAALSLPRTVEMRSTRSSKPSRKTRSNQCAEVACHCHFQGHRACPPVPRPIRLQCNIQYSIVMTVTGFDV